MVMDIQEVGTVVPCIAIGDHISHPAEVLQKLTRVPYTLFQSLAGLRGADRIVPLLSATSGAPAPAKIGRRRAQLQDALVNGHFYCGGKKIAIAAGPDQRCQLATFFTSMGEETTTGTSKILEKTLAGPVQIGDLGELESIAADSDLLVTHSHGLSQAAELLGVPLMRVSFPIVSTSSRSPTRGRAIRCCEQLPGEPTRFEAWGTCNSQKCHMISIRRQSLAADRVHAVMPQRQVGPLSVAISTPVNRGLNAHFVLAKRFAVYDVHDDWSFVRVLTLDDVSGESGVHRVEEDVRITLKLRALKGCHLLFCLAIGGPSAAKVVSSKIHPIKVPNPQSIEDKTVAKLDHAQGGAAAWLPKAVADAAAAEDNSFEDED